MSKIYTITHDATRIYALSITEPTEADPNDTEPSKPSIYSVEEFDTKQEALDWITQEELTMPDGLRWPDDTPVPQEVGAAQIRVAMLMSGIATDLATLDGMVETMLTGNDIGLTLWRHATRFKRDYPLILQMGQALGKTEAEIDDLFRLAETI